MSSERALLDVRLAFASLELFHIQLTPLPENWLCMFAHSA